MRKKNITRKANFRLLLGMGESLGIPTHSWLYLRFLSVTLLSQQTVRCFLFSCYNGIPSAALFPISTRPMARPISIQYISLTKFEISTIRSLLVSTNLMRMHFIHHQPIKSHEFQLSNLSGLNFLFIASFPMVMSFGQYLSNMVLVHLYNYCHIHTVKS